MRGGRCVMVMHSQHHVRYLGALDDDVFVRDPEGNRCALPLHEPAHEGALLVCRLPVAQHLLRCWDSEEDGGLRDLYLRQPSCASTDPARALADVIDH